MTKPARRPIASFTPFTGRHAEPTPTAPDPSVEEAAETEKRARRKAAAARAKEQAKERGLVIRPLRLSAATNAKLQQFALTRGDISLTAAVTLAICEEWNRVFRPSTETVVDEVQRLLADSGSARAPTDTVLPSADAKRSSRTLRLGPDVDAKLGELAQQQGGLDRNSTITVVIVSAWRRACSRS